MVSGIPPSRSEERIEVEGKEKKHCSKGNYLFAWVRSFVWFLPISDLLMSTHGRRTKELRLCFSCLCSSEVMRSSHLQRQRTQAIGRVKAELSPLTCTATQVTVLSCTSAFWPVNQHRLTRTCDSVREAQVEKRKNWLTLRLEQDWDQRTHGVQQKPEEL